MADNSEQLITKLEFIVLYLFARFNSIRQVAPRLTFICSFLSEHSASSRLSTITVHSDRYENDRIKIVEK